jgi:hypothetical protein
MKKVRLTTFVMFLITVFVISGCGGKDSGTFVINTSGGIGGISGGSGGNGGIVVDDSDDSDENILLTQTEHFPVVGLIVTYAYSSGQPVTVTSTGIADAAFRATNPNVDLGENPLLVTQNTVISVESSEPATGVAYFASTGSEIYISDGNGIMGDQDTAQDPVTGIQVYGGRTLTLAVNSEIGASVSLDNDFLNNGTVTTRQNIGPLSPRVNISLNCGRFINRGKISLEGIEPGQGGGSFFVTSASLHNRGPIHTFGADNSEGDGGDGGQIFLRSYGLLENTATINAYGGNATGTEGAGGYSDLIQIVGNIIHNSGAINAYSGNGVDSREPRISRGVSLGSQIGEYGSSGSSKFSLPYGPVLNSGTIKTYGGNAISGDGDNGGMILIGVDGGREVRNSGSLYSYGGSTESLDSNGGNGGPICIGQMPISLLLYYTSGEENKLKNSKDLEPLISSDLPFNIQVSGNLETNGGKVPSDPSATGSGGDGGFITVVHAGSFDMDMDSDSLSSQKLELLGYGGINTSGGDANSGGFGGSVIFGQLLMPAIHPGVVNHVPVLAKGGNGLIDPQTNSARGGSGGSVDFGALGLGDSFGLRKPTDGDTKVRISYVETPANIINTAPIVTSGGRGYNAEDNYGAAGNVAMVAWAEIDNSGPIYANGGNDIGDEVLVDSGFGGASGLVAMQSYSDGITNTASINASGGKGAYRGGNWDYANDSRQPVGIYLNARGFIQCPGSITADGGNANPLLEGSVGGSGGTVILECLSGPGAIRHGSISAKAGTGWVAGELNNIVVGGILIQEGTVELTD